ncbi:tetratricopeptide repeat protein [Roseovarius sp.]|uniref:tetratricopeptide repeat protein n=1 Tax=Roseovarius sp. TaxID=1486281 RepID=UPI003B59E73A
MTSLRLWSIPFAALLWGPDAAEARMSAPERQLAVFDCQSGDEAACAALVASYPHYNDAGMVSGTYERHYAAALAEASAGCDAGGREACTDHASLVHVREGTDAPEVYARWAAGCDAGDGFACALLSDLNFSLIGFAGTSYESFYAEQAEACATGDVTACISQSRLNVLVPQAVPDRAIWFDQLRRLCDEEDAARACALMSYIQSHAGAEEYAVFDPGFPDEVENKQRYALWDAEKACELGNPVGCYNAGLAHDEGQAVNESWKRAQEYYVRACRGGFRYGCDEINRETYWRPTDNLLAMKKACEAGDFSACHYDAVHAFAPITTALRTDEDKARMAAFAQDLERICKDGWVRACADLGTLSRAMGDLVKAERFATAACALSEGMGCLVVGNLLKLDRGTEAALKQAVGYHRMGCELRVWMACNNFGDSYQHGRGVAADPGQAARYFVIACNNEVALGCRNMAQLKKAEAPEEAADYRERACALDAQDCRQE